jgi:hypothetical protein
MSHQDLPPEIEVYDIGKRRLYVKTGARYFAISEDDLTPEELLGIARDIAMRQARLVTPRKEKAFA